MKKHIGILQQETMDSWNARKRNDLARSVRDATIKPVNLASAALREKERLYQEFLIRPLQKNYASTYGCEPDEILLESLKKNDGLYHPNTIADDEQLMVGIGYDIIKPREIYITEKRDKQRFSTVHNFRLAQMGMKFCTGDKRKSFAWATGTDLKLLDILAMHELEKKGLLFRKGK